MCNVDDCTWRSLNSFVFPLFSFFMLALTSQVAQTVKRLPTRQETWVQSLGREDPQKRKWQLTLILLPGKSHGQKSLVGYSPWGRKELDVAE